MSWSTNQTIFRQKRASGEDLSGQEGRVVHLNSSAVYMLADAAGEDRGALSDGDVGGILLDGGTASGDMVTVGIGVVWALPGGAITEGDLITGASTTDSRVVEAVTSGDIPLGRAMSDAAAASTTARVKINYLGPVDEAIA
jgi:hypothetical protein